MQNPAGDIYAAGGGVRERMSDAAAVADNIKTFMRGFKVIIDLDLHIIEFDLDPVKEGIVIRGAGRDLIEGVDHLDYSVKNPLGKNEAQIARSGFEGRIDAALDYPLHRGASASFEIAESLDDDTAAEHIGKARNALAVFVAVFEGVREMLADKQGKIRIFRLQGRILVAVTVYGDDPVCILIDNGTVRIHAEGTHSVLKFLGPVNYFALIELIGDAFKNDCGQFNADSEIDSVGFGGDLKIFADRLHPFAAAPADRNNAVFRLCNQAF